jgi:hypothetical protein
VKTIPKDFQKCLHSITNAIQYLQDGDPLLILHWNDDTIGGKSLVNPAFTKAALVAHVIANNGQELVANEAFGFRTMAELHECKETVPLWAISLGPQCCAIQGIPVPDPVARAMLVVGTNRVIPDVSLFSFFQR